MVDGKAHKAVVKTGIRVPGKVQVVEGLKAGDVVITAGQAKPMMHEGMGVMVLPAGGGDKPGAKPDAATGAPDADEGGAAVATPAANEASTDAANDTKPETAAEDAQ